MLSSSLPHCYVTLSCTHEMCHKCVTDGEEKEGGRERETERERFEFSVCSHLRTVDRSLMDVRVNTRFLGFWKVEGGLKWRDLCFTNVICLVFVFRDNFPALAEQ